MDTLGLLIDDAKKKKKPWQNSNLLPELQPPPVIPGAKKVNAVDNANTKKSTGGTGVLPSTLNEVTGNRTYWNTYTYYVSMSGLSVMVSKPIKSIKFIDPATSNNITLNYSDTSNNQVLNVNQGLPPSIP